MSVIFSALYAKCPYYLVRVYYTVVGERRASVAAGAAPTALSAVRSQLGDLSAVGIFMNEFGISINTGGRRALFPHWGAVPAAVGSPAVAASSGAGTLVAAAGVRISTIPILVTWVGKNQNFKL